MKPTEPNRERRIAVIGAGHVGITTAAFLAHLHHEVRCADIDPERVRELSQGRTPIAEEGLDLLVQEGLASGRLDFVLGAAGRGTGPVTSSCLLAPSSDPGVGRFTHRSRTSTGFGSAAASSSAEGAFTPIRR
jgi:UDPglucose 6-dehydrogenase